jgi:predicted Zn finger-like uncharacterized protein
MSEKQTKCPECSSTYKVTVTQLTAAQGLVCCPKCSATFNALTHLKISTAGQESVTSYKNDKFKNNISPSTDTDEASTDILSIFDKRVEHSNIDLRTYLNNLNYFSTDPINTFPTLNLAEDIIYENARKNSASYYTLWVFINILLIGILMFQILMFNPKFLNNNNVISHTYNKVCHLFRCAALDAQYDLLEIRKAEINLKVKTSTIIHGTLINKNETSVPLPLLRLTLLDKDGATVYLRSFEPEEYLISSLHEIERIPQNSPFSFVIKAPIHQKHFNHYKIEIIRP